MCNIRPLGLVLSASSHMTRNSSLLSSYHPTPSHPPVTIVDGRLCPIQGRGTTRVTPSLSLHQILYVHGFPVNLLSISAITRALPCTVTLFPFHYIFQDLYIEQRIGLGRENGQDIYELVANRPSSGLQALFVTSTATSSLLWHCHLGHLCFEKFKKPYHGFLLVNLCASHVSWANIIDLLTLVAMASPVLHLLIFFIVMFGVPLVSPPFQVIATISCLLMTILM